MPSQSPIYRYLAAGIITIVALFLVWYFRDIVAYILIAAVLAILGKPLMDLLSRLHIGKSRIRMPRTVAALLTLLSIWIVALGVLMIFVPVVFKTIEQLSSMSISGVIASFQAPISGIENFIYNTFSVRPSEFSLTEAISQQITPLLNINLLNNLLSSIVGTLTDTVILAFSTSFITFFFLKESSLFESMVTILFPKKYEESLARALDSITKLLIRYFTGIVTESSIMICIVSVGLLLWGFSLQQALMIGLLVGVLNVIPYLGPLIGIALGSLVGMLGMAPDASIGVLILQIACTILFAQGVDNFVLQPVLYSKQAKAHPLEIFLVILIAGSVAGVLGMLLAIPSYNVLRVFAKEFFYNFRVVQKLTEKI